MARADREVHEGCEKWTTGLRSQLLWPAVSVFVLGAFFGYLVKQTNSLWPSIAAHVVNNLIETLLTGR